MYSSLPSHSAIFFSIEVWLLNLNSLGNVFTLYFDNQFVKTWSPSLASALLSGGKYCSESGASCKTTVIKGVVMHSASSLTLKIQSLSSLSNVFFLGIRSVSLLFTTSTSYGSTSTCDYSGMLLSMSCLCPDNQYPAVLLGCASCNSLCGTCLTSSSSSDCTSCTSGTSYNGHSCYRCSSSCSQCSGPANTDCIRCQSGSYLYSNGTCLPECQSPLIVTTEGSYASCISPCNSSSLFLYSNGTCMTSCSYPFTQVATSDATYCKFICQGAQSYLYWDGSCRASCPTPLVTTTSGVAQFCGQPCPTNYYYYPNATCLPTCSDPYVNMTQNGLLLCNRVCGSSEYLYWNGTCSSSCPDPLVRSSQGSNQFCNLPCPFGQYYYTKNNSCIPSCAPAFQTVNNSIASCSNYCTPDTYLYWNYTCLSTCTASLLSIYDSQLYQTCNKPCQNSDYLYPNGSCISFCNYTQQVSVDGVNMCIYPCNTTQCWFSNNRTCLNSCPDSYVRVDVDAYLADCVLSSSLIESTSNSVRTSISSNDTQVSSTAATVATVAKYFASANIFRPTDSSSVFMISLTKILKYVKFIQVKIPDRYRDLLDSNKSSIFSVSTAFGYSMPANLPDKLPKYELPSIFEGAGYHSSYLINFWDAMSTYSILIGLGFCFYLLEKMIVRWKSINRVNYIIALVLQRMRILTYWNFLLIIMFNTYDDMTLFAILQYQTLHFTCSLEAVSFVVCTAITVISIYFLIMACRLSFKATQDKVRIIPQGYSEYQENTLHFSERWSTYQIFYSGYKNDSFSKQACLLFQTIRIIACYLIVGLLYNYPLVQTAILNIISVIMLLYFIIKKPFRSSFNLMVTLLFEVLIFTVNFCLLMLVLLDISNDLSVASQTNLSDVIIICNSCVDMLGNILTWLYIVTGAWGFYKETRSCDLRGKLVWINLLVAMYTGPGMDMDVEPYVKKSCAKSSSGECPIQEVKILEEKSSRIEMNVSPPRRKNNSKFQRTYVQHKNSSLFSVRNYEEDHRIAEASLCNHNEFESQVMSSAKIDFSGTCQSPTDTIKDLTPLIKIHKAPLTVYEQNQLFRTDEMTSLQKEGISPTSFRTNAKSLSTLFGPAGDSRDSKDQVAEDKHKFTRRLIFSKESLLLSPSSYRARHRSRFNSGLSNMLSPKTEMLFSAEGFNDVCTDENIIITPKGRLLTHGFTHTRFSREA